MKIENVWCTMATSGKQFFFVRYTTSQSVRHTRRISASLFRVLGLVCTQAKKGENIPAHMRVEAARQFQDFQQQFTRLVDRAVQDDTQLELVTATISKEDAQEATDQFKIVVSKTNIFDLPTIIQQYQPEVILSADGKVANYSTFDCGTTTPTLKVSVRNEPNNMTKIAKVECGFKLDLQDGHTLSYVYVQNGKWPRQSADIIVLENVRKEMPASILKSSPNYVITYFSTLDGIAILGKQDLRFSGLREIARDVFLIAFPHTHAKPAEVAPTLDMQRINQLWSSYTQGCAFPKWSIELAPTIFERLMPLARVFYDFVPKNVADAVKHVKRLVLEREPANVTREKWFDVQMFQQKFGWSTGYYDSFFREFQTLAANIMVYTPSFVVQWHKNWTDHVVHILNVIGYAFDDEEQSDYQYFVNTISPDKRVNLLIHRYERLITNIFLIVARQFKMSNVVMSFFGAENFASKYPEGKKAFQDQVWMPAFEKAMTSKPESLVVHFMGDAAPVKKRFPNVKFHGFWPNAIRAFKDTLDDVMWINAWDPLSVPGNGNQCDASLDGYVGRSSAIGIIGTSITNPYLSQDGRYTSVDTLRE
jgi:hypothetical protein